MKIIISIIVLSIAVLGGIIFFATKTNQASGVAIDATKVDKGQLVRSDSHQTGNKDANVTLVEFGDFQCPACQAAEPAVEQITKDYADKISFVYRDFPLPMHQNAKNAAMAGEAANAQGKFWEMKALLFQKQSEWENATNPEPLFISYARSLNLNTDQFTKDLTNQGLAKHVSQDLGDAEALNLQGTPTFFINGQEFTQAATYDNFKTTLDAQLK